MAKKKLATKIPPIQVNPISPPTLEDFRWSVELAGQTVWETLRNMQSMVLDALGDVVWQPAPGEGVPAPAEDVGLTCTSWEINATDPYRIKVYLPRQMTDAELAAPTPWNLLVTTADDAA